MASTFGKQVLPLGNVGGSAVVAYVLAEDLDRRFRDVFASLVETAAALVRATVGRLSVRVHRSLAPARVRGGTAAFLESFGAATGDTWRVVVATTLAVSVGGLASLYLSATVWHALD